MILLVQLPAPQSPPIPAFEVSATLDEVTYTLHFQWNVSDAAWYMRVLDEPGQTVLMGDWRVGADWPMYRNRIDRSPPGLLVVLDTRGDGDAPGLSDLGARHLLYYFTEDELPEGF